MSEKKTGNNAKKGAIKVRIDTRNESNTQFSDPSTSGLITDGEEFDGGIFTMQKLGTLIAVTIATTEYGNAFIEQDAGEEGITGEVEIELRWKDGEARLSVNGQEPSVAKFGEYKEIGMFRLKNVRLGPLHIKDENSAVFSGKIIKELPEQYFVDFSEMFDDFIIGGIFLSKETRVD